MTNRIKALSGMCLALAMTLGATFAFAFSEAGLIRACVNNSSGNIKIVQANARCKNNETLLEWNAAGGGNQAANSSVFAFTGVAYPNSGDLCTNLVGDTIECSRSFIDYNTPLPRAGRLVAVALHPYHNNLTTNVSVTVYVNDAPTALEVIIPAGSTADVIVEGSVNVAAGDLVKLVTPTFAQPTGDPMLRYSGTLLYEYP
jgi:hypothetical protein